jgi:hypothetical protein
MNNGLIKKIKWATTEIVRVTLTWFSELFRVLQVVYFVF